MITIKNSKTIIFSDMFWNDIKLYKKIYLKMLILFEIMSVSTWIYHVVL